MQNKHHAIAEFKKLEPHHISTLTNQEMRKLLETLHEQVRNGAFPFQQKACRKTKFIQKTYYKLDLKEHVRKNIHSILNRSIKRVANHHNNNSRVVLQKGDGLKEGKLNLKQPTKSPQHKFEKFANFIRSALKETHNDQLSCSICLQPLICPALTVCGHTFCLQCIDESMLFSHNCPNCRQNIRGSQPIQCPLLDSLIRYKVEQQGSEQLNHYRQRLRKFQAWRADRILPYDKMSDGQLVDVRDTESIWCQGTIIEIYRKYDSRLGARTEIAVLVHYNRWNKIYNEVIELPSCRLAPLSCFSGRIDIPRYNLSEEDNNMRGSVISGVSRLELQPGFNFYSNRLYGIQSEVEMPVVRQPEPIQLMQSEEQSSPPLRNLAPDSQDQMRPRERISQRQNRFRDLMNRIERNVIEHMSDAHRRFVPLMIARRFFSDNENSGEGDDNSEIQSQEIEEENLIYQDYNQLEEQVLGDEPIEISSENEVIPDEPIQSLSEINELDRLLEENQEQEMDPMLEQIDLLKEESSERIQNFGMKDPRDLLGDYQ